MPDIELRGSEPCLSEKAIQGSEVSLSRVDRSRYIKLVLISFVNPHSLAVSNGRSFRLEGSERRQGVSGFKLKD